MIFKKPLQLFLFPTANLLIAAYLLTAFWSYGQHIVQTIPESNAAALNKLKPEPMDYFWKISMENAPVSKPRIRYYLDYYELLLKNYPFLGETYGLMGYSYYYLGDTVRAIDCLKKGININPLYTWNYYNLGIIYIKESRYEEASNIFKKLLVLDPKISLIKMFSSQYVYLPLLKVADNAQMNLRMKTLAQHLGTSYNNSYRLLEILKEIPYANDIKSALGKINLELYVF